MHLGSSGLPSNKNYYIDEHCLLECYMTYILITSVEDLSISLIVVLFLNICISKHFPSIWSCGGGVSFKVGAVPNAENRERLKVRNNAVGILKGQGQYRRNISLNTLIPRALITADEHHRGMRCIFNIAVPPHSGRLHVQFSRACLSETSALIARSHVCGRHTTLCSPRQHRPTCACGGMTWRSQTLH
jgi:hypothetical protein